MQFKGLRLQGFKSFVEATELEIGQGLTGIVGPNGCGKSNLVEALRWAMGETSAKRMRGGEMDDVIFAGTNNRPARNLAEVTLLLDNSARTAPAFLNDADDLEVTRRIERGTGSDYIVNSKAVRAKDVALLFQDNATGPHSAALVSQGRIGALIAAKPTERRLLLEEAAGITGLHTRRHEAELKLKAAENNLQRVEDVLGTMDAQLSMLKKQARQASRYRNINAEVRRQEAALLHLRWSALRQQILDSEEALALAATAVTTLGGEVARLETARLEAADALPAKRQAEAEAAATLQRLNLAREQLEAEGARLKATTEAAHLRQAQAKTDEDREAALYGDATTALTRLTDEIAEIFAADVAAESTTETIAIRVEETTAARRMAEELVADLQGQISTAEGRASGLSRQLADITQRYQKASTRLAEVDANIAKLEADKLSDLFVHTARSEAEQATATLVSAEAASQVAEQQAEAADTAYNSARSRLQQSENTTATLVAERDALKKILSASQSDFPAVLELVKAAPGYEQALAAALGDDLSLPTDSAAHAYWQNLPPLEVSPSWPEGVSPLANYVSAPPELARRLSFIGVTDEAAAYSSRLGPGQTLVTREGAVYTWDGKVIKAGAPTAAALRLQQQNRLTVLEQEIALASRHLEAEREGVALLAATATATAAARREARTAHEQAMAIVLKAQAAASEAEAALVATNSRLTSLAENRQNLEAEVSALATDVARLEAEQAALPDVSATRLQLETARILLQTAQSEAADSEAQRRQLQREEELRLNRITTLQSEESRWQERRQGAAQRMIELQTRQQEAAAELASLAARPGEIEAQRQSLFTQLSEAEAVRRQQADQLSEAEATLAEREKSLKQAEQALAEARELRVRIETEATSYEGNKAALLERIAEKCECTPEELPALAELALDMPQPEPEAIEARLNKLLREREALGPVNLRAEQEVDELQAQMDNTNREKDELISAIAKFRGAIGSISREARERLLAAFDEVNSHFQRLFTRLFGGGTAALKLTEAEDPLEAGLEVVAQPPGKKLQNLTLLSGGEQALASMALIFAVFLTNPAPICVLDEVDAPLDEANIDRYCNLLEDMAKETKTRFLVTTHQRLTMSRMHRLYGVTMAERGVSQLVSVNLEAAAAMRDAA